MTLMRLEQPSHRLRLVLLRLTILGPSSFMLRFDQWLFLQPFLYAGWFYHPSIYVYQDYSSSARGPLDMKQPLGISWLPQAPSSPPLLRPKPPPCEGPVA